MSKRAGSSGCSPVLPSPTKRRMSASSRAWKICSRMLWSKRESSLLMNPPVSTMVKAFFVPHGGGIVPVPGDSRQVIDKGLGALAYPVEKSGFADVGASYDCNYRHERPPFHKALAKPPQGAGGSSAGLPLTSRSVGVRMASWTFCRRPSYLCNDQVPV